MSRLRLTTGMLALGLVLVQAGIADENSNGGTAGAFLRVGVDARSMAMGNTGFAWAGSAAGRLLNPALLARQDQLQFSLGMMALSQDRSLNAIHAVLPLRPMGALGVSWVGAGVDGIKETTTWGEYTGRDLEYAENAFSFGFGLKPAEAFTIGLALDVNSAAFRKVTEGGDEVKANNATFSIGASIKPRENWFVGLSARGLLGTYEWDSTPLWGNDGESSASDTIPTLMGIGVATRQLDDRLLLLCDYEVSSEDAWDLRLGAEYTGPVQENGDWAVRGGWDDGSLSFGLGLGWLLKGKRLGLDYAVVMHEYDPDELHSFNFNFGF